MTDYKKIKRVHNRDIYKKLDLLIIDEISMVRSDLLDCVAQFLKQNGPDYDKPLGGVQLLCVGDLFQLPPIVADNEERNFIRSRYRSEYFFSARCLHQDSTWMKYVEFSEVFRQENAEFISLLNNIREGVNLQSTLDVINSSCMNRDWGTSPSVYLTANNAQADRINKDQLDLLPGNYTVFEGSVWGTFANQDKKLPAPINLCLKDGAQVMFTKNNHITGWVNGTLGIIRDLDHDKIHVEICGGRSNRMVVVAKETWENIKYKYDPDEDEIISEVVGQYTQFPLTPAWAFTIHKSQGKTLDRVTLDLDRGAFATGQVYVALSRCRALDDIKLVKPIRLEDVKIDERIEQFYAPLRAWAENQVEQSLIKGNRP